MKITDELLERNLVDKSHIDLLKRIKVKPNHFTYYYDTEVNEKIDSVDVSKIIGLGMRGESGESWWGHIHFSSGTLDIHRIKRFIKKNDLLNKTRSEINNLFSSKDFIRSKDNVKLEYYAEDDVYFVSNGNHRTMVAKLFNVPSIRAEVCIKKFNDISYENYKKYTKGKKSLFGALEDQGYELFKRINPLKDEFDVYYQGIIVRFLTYEKPVQFSETRKIDDLINNFEEDTESLLNFSKRIQFYNRIPKLIRLRTFMFLTFFSSFGEIENNQLKKIIKNS